MKVFEPGLESSAYGLLGIEQHQPRSDQFSIDEPERLSFGWQKVSWEGRFSCALRSERYYRISRRHLLPDATKYLTEAAE